MKDEHTLRESAYRPEFLASDVSDARTSEGEEISLVLGVYLRTLCRGARTIFTATLGALVIAAAAAYLIRPWYTSTASLIPPSSSNSSSAAALMGQLSQMSGLSAGSLLGSAKTPGDLYVGILKSRSIASELVSRFDLKKVYRVKKESDAEKRLASNSAFDVGIKDSIVTISVSDKSPERARDLANAYLDVLREKNGDLALNDSSQRRLFFGQQLAKEKDALEDAEVELKKTEEQSGLIAPAGQTEAEIGTIAQTQAQIASRQVQLAALRDSATEEYPEVVRLRSEIADLQGQLAQLQKGSGSTSTATIPTSKVPEVQLEYVRKEREVKYHDALFDMLSRQYEAARLDEAHDAPVLQVLDPASYPDSRSGPKRLYIMLGGLLAGFLGSCVWVLFRDPARAFFSSAAAVRRE